MSRKPPRHARRPTPSERAALRDLARVRAPLFEELERLERDPGYLKGRSAHVCCTREFNQMRVSPLEARAIAEAFRTDPELRRKLSDVLTRLAGEVARLRDDEERQNFTCPLLEGTRCLVHDVAKPIGCTAWHPAAFDADDFQFTENGWHAFEARDHLNDLVYGPDWKLRVIPLWLERVLAEPESGQSAVTEEAEGG